MRSSFALAALVLVVAAPAAAASRPPAFLGCGAFFAKSGQKPMVRPRFILIACGDGGLVLNNLRWSSWSNAGARATGEAVVNDCTPSCVAGHFHTYRATVRLARPRACRDRLYFTRLVLTYRGATSTQTYPAC